MNGFLLALAALIPSAGVAFLFVVAMRALINADRRERAAIARIEGEQDGDNQPSGGA